MKIVRIIPEFRILSRLFKKTGTKLGDYTILIIFNKTINHLKLKLLTFCKHTANFKISKESRILEILKFHLCCIDMLIFLKDDTVNVLKFQT